MMKENLEKLIHELELEEKGLMVEKEFAQRTHTWSYLKYLENKIEFIGFMLIKLRTIVTKG